MIVSPCNQVIAMPKLTLDKAITAHAKLHALFLAHPDRITLPRLAAYLDLLAHLERIDVKLARTAEGYARRHGLTAEQRRVAEAYVRGEEGKRKRRNTYVGWSFMIRRYVRPVSSLSGRR